MYARDEFFHVERLCDVVVCADVEPAYLVSALSSGRDKDDRPPPALPEHPAQLEPIPVRKLNVEQNQVRRKILALSKRIVRGCRQSNIKAVDR